MSWVEVPEGGDHFKRYPDKGIEEWHKDEELFCGGEEPAAEVKEKNKKQKTK